MIIDRKESRYSITFRGKQISHVLFETHEVDCTCSYCKGSSKLHFGLNIPKDKSRNSWWVIKYTKTKYLRWTNSWKKSADHNATLEPRVSIDAAKEISDILGKEIK